MHAPLPRTVRTVRDLRDVVRDWRAAGDLVALVPTMGGLHEGHLSLVQTARKRARRVVASIFVNPAQFGPDEDYESYPRREAEDAAMLGAAGCDLLFAPSAAEMYPENFSTLISVADVTESLCGTHRPGHFDGVTTVVAKLLNQAQPDYAVFGEKDWQQLVAIKRMVKDLDMPVRILSAPTVREEDGLAMSSRNRYLGDEARATAAKLNKALRASAEIIADGASIERVLDACVRALREGGFDGVDYVDVCTAATLDPVEELDPRDPARMFAAVRLGRARLIDNVPIPDRSADA